MKEIEESIKRIRNIDWNYKKSDLPSHAFLVTEFIKRGNLFRDVYCPEKKARKPIYSAARILGYEDKIDLDIQRLVEELGLLNYGWTIEYLCKFYLE